MRNTYLIAYDICCPKRYRKIYKTICGHGEPLQLSVFRCDLTTMELQQLQMKLWDLLNLGEDRIMIVNLGPLEGLAAERIEFWGQPLALAGEHQALIV